MRGLLATALTIVATTAWSQDAPSEAQVKLADRAIRDGDYLAAPDLWRPLALNPDGGIRDDGAWQQYAVAVSRLTGEPPFRPTPAAVKPIDADRATIARIEQAETRDALREIVDRARRTRIVILNEYHLVPRSRAFALQVARALRPLGYDVFAAETFSNDPDADRYAAKMAALVAAGHVGRRTGYYTQDPVFASFVRDALAIGYRPVAYEATSYVSTDTPDERIVRREQQQADYLMTRALGDYPGSKIFILVGHGHVREAPRQRADGMDALPWMAARLKQASGIDPLTIDQTEFLRPAVDPTGVTAAATARAKDGSIVLVDRAGPLVLGQWTGTVDLQVVHPRLAPLAGRPGWLAALGRRRVPVPRALLPTTGRRLIQAFPKGAADDSVPIDQVVVYAGKPPPMLMLDHRPFELRFATNRVPNRRLTLPPHHPVSTSR